MIRTRFATLLYCVCALAACAPAVAAEVVVQVLQNRFDPEVVSVTNGDDLVFQVVSGSHRLTALDPALLPGFDSGQLGRGQQYQYQVSGLTGAAYFASDGAEGMTGALEVVSGPPNFTIDEQVSAGWFNPAADGQGLLFEYVPSTNVLVAYWFTYEFEGGRQLWLIGTGTPQDQRVTLTMLEAQGGRINNPQPVSKPVWGEITVDFSGCENATVYYDAANDQRSGRVSLDRLYLNSLCQ